MTTKCGGTSGEVPKLRESKAYCEGRTAAAAGWTETAATATTGDVDDTNALAWTSKVSGDRVEGHLVDPGAESQDLAVSVSGTIITASLATDANGDITTTGTLLDAAIGASSAANALVDVDDTSGSSGAGVVVAESVRLTGSDHPHAYSPEDIVAYNAGVTSWTADPSGVSTRDCCADAYGGGFGD